MAASELCVTFQNDSTIEITSTTTFRVVWIWADGQPPLWQPFCSYLPRQESIARYGLYVSIWTSIKYWPLWDLAIISSIIFNLIIQNSNLVTRAFSVNLLSGQCQRMPVKSVLIQVMAWCRQTTNRYLTWCWLRSPTPCGPTMSYIKVPS